MNQENQPNENSSSSQLNGRRSLMHYCLFVVFFLLWLSTGLFGENPMGSLVAILTGFGALIFLLMAFAASREYKHEDYQEKELGQGVNVISKLTIVIAILWLMYYVMVG